MSKITVGKVAFLNRIDVGTSFGNMTCLRMQDVKKEHTQHPVQHLKVTR